MMRRVRGSAVVAIVVRLLSAPDVARATRGRVALSLLAGGGYASDVFVGAGLGRDGFFQVTPSGRLDLSLAPRWKFAATGDVAYGRYVSSEFTAFSQSASVEGRWLGGDAWEASLSASGEHARYSLAVPVDPTLPSSASVSSTLAARIAPLVRVRAAGLEWRAAGVAGARSSTSGDATVPEKEGALLAGALLPVSEELSVAVTYKIDRTASERPDFTFTSHALFGLAAWRLRSLDLEAQLQLQTAALGTGTGEKLARVTASAAYPVTDAVALEAVYAFTASHSDDPARGSASLHLAFVAARWRFLETTW